MTTTLTSLGIIIVILVIAVLALIITLAVTVNMLNKSEAKVSCLKEQCTDIKQETT